MLAADRFFHIIKTMLVIFFQMYSAYNAECVSLLEFSLHAVVSDSTLEKHKFWPDSPSKSDKKFFLPPNLAPRADPDSFSG